MIEVRHVTKTYGKKQNVFVALNDVSFKIQKGASVAIVGKSGSGKSTLMHAISGLDRPEKGEVIIDGDDILKLNKKAVDQFRATKMSFIFQSFFVQGNETCYDNVSLPLEIAGVPKRSRRERVVRALEAVELGEKIKSRARDLSGGQKQRLAIARAIVNEPRILFADEPTGNLDSATGDVIEKLLFDYCKTNGATLIVVTHDHDLASKCDMQVYIKDGTITNVNGGKEKQPESRKISVTNGKRAKK